MFLNSWLSIIKFLTCFPLFELHHYWFWLWPEKIVVKRKLNKDTAAFKTNPTNNTIGGIKERISTYFAWSCTVSCNNQTEQKGFTLKLQPTIAQILDSKISIFEETKDVVEDWSQNRALEMVLAGVNKNISQAATAFNYECSIHGVQGYHQAYLGHFMINSKKPTPPPKVKVNEHDDDKTEHGILEALSQHL